MAASNTKVIDCSICKVTFDEDHGVWVCLGCTEKLTNAIHQASLSPQPQLHQQINHSNYSPKNQPQRKRGGSLPKDVNINTNITNVNEMTLFLELENNGNKRRFKYKPNDLHSNISLISIKEHLLKRFSHDVDLKKILISSKQINNLSSFEVNDKQYQHQFIIFETLNDLFDGAKIKINIDKFYFKKYEIGHNGSKSKKGNKLKSKSSTNKLDISSIRRRSKSASSINDDFLSNRDILSLPPDFDNNNNNNINNNDDNDEKKMDLRINTKSTKIIGKNERLKYRNKHGNDDIVSPKYHGSHQVSSSSFDIIAENDKSDIGNNECIIIDNGSGLIKCGFGGLSDNTGPHGPQIVFPSAYFNAPHKYGAHISNSNIEIGDKAIDIADKLSLYNTSSLVTPIKRGFITNWNEMEYIWDNILNHKLKRLFNQHNNQTEMEYHLKNHPLLMTERFQTPYKNREKLLEIMFESHEIPSLYLAHSACLAIYGTGS